MSKFCQNCGALLDDNVAFCSSCGAKMTDGYPEEPVTVNAQNAPKPNPYEYHPEQSYPQQPAYTQQPSYPQQPAYPRQQYPAAPAPAPKKKGKKVAVIVVVSVLVLALIAAAVLIVVLPLVANIDVFGLHLFGGAKASTPQECVETFLESLADDNIDGVLDCIYETKYSELMRSVFKAQLSSGGDMGEGLQQIRSMGSDNVKKMVALTVKDEKPMEESRAATLKTTLSQGMVPIDKIEKIETAKVHMENKMTNETQDSDFAFAYAEGKWYILASAMSGQF